MKRFDLGFAMVGLAAAGVVAVGVLFVRDAFSPPPLRFEAIATPSPVVVAGATLIIQTETSATVDQFECAVTTLFYIRGADGYIAKVTGTKEISETNQSEYLIQLPDDLEPGQYGARIRENYACPSKRVQFVDTPWTSFRVVE